MKSPSVKVIDSPEKLWQECVHLSKNKKVINSELFDGRSSHYVLAYGPVAQRNRYQSLLYTVAGEFNVSTLPIHKIDLFSNIPWPGKVVCHFHWIDDKTKNAKSLAEAETAVRDWENVIYLIKERGHKIVWTVHNVLPHESNWLEQDIKIHQLMADSADALHIMASDTVSLTSKYYKLDESKVFHVPHPIYEGSQPNVTTREIARMSLGFDKDQFVFLSFGAIMKYKGYDILMDSYDEIRNKTHQKVKLVIAGIPVDHSLAAEIQNWSEQKSDVIVDFSPIPNEKLQIYFRAADLAVCPYSRTLNSGVAMMALTFGLPVVGPNSGVFHDLGVRKCAITFGDSDNNTLTNVLLRSMGKESDKLRERIMFERKHFAPGIISYRFFSSIQKLKA